MHKAVIVAVVVFVCLPALLTAKGAARARKAKAGRLGETTALPTDCGSWNDGQCVVKNNATCGKGTMIKTRTGENCPEKEKSAKCEVPCAGGAGKAPGNKKGNRNRKAVCKYTKGPWSDCDAVSNTRTRTETLKPSRRNSAPSTDCEPTRVQTKKCPPAGRKNRRGPNGQ